MGPSEIKMYVYVMLIYVKRHLCISCTKKMNKKFSQSINQSYALISPLTKVVMKTQKLTMHIYEIPSSST